MSWSRHATADAPAAPATAAATPALAPKPRAPASASDGLAHVQSRVRATTRKADRAALPVGAKGRARKLRHPDDPADVDWCAALAHESDSETDWEVEAAMVADFLANTPADADLTVFCTSPDRKTWMHWDIFGEKVSNIRNYAKRGDRIKLLAVAPGAPLSYYDIGNGSATENQVDQRHNRNGYIIRLLYILHQARKDRATLRALIKETVLESARAAAVYKQALAGPPPFSGGPVDAENQDQGPDLSGMETFSDQRLERMRARGRAARGVSRDDVARMES